MARIARVVIPHVPHHVTQRGNRRLPTFLREDDYRAYIGMMADWCKHCGVEVWAYCLMPNHVHLIAVPQTETALARAIGEAHRRYTRRVNQREGWQGHLWQSRFGSCPVDDTHLYAAVQYVEQNPVRAGLAARAEDYHWSSARAHLAGRDDHLVRVAPLLERWPGWREMLNVELTAESIEGLRRHERTGRPLGSEQFVAKCEAAVSRELRPKSPGRPRQAPDPQRNR
jgi:putative transposase